MKHSTTLTAGSTPLWAMNDRILIDGRRAVIKEHTETRITIAWREAWYWQLAWKLEDWCGAIRRWFSGLVTA